jgi:hypothetical protein
MEKKGAFAELVSKSLKQNARKLAISDNFTDNTR